MGSGGARANSGPARLPVEVKKALGTYRPRDGQTATVGIRLPVVQIGDPPAELRPGEQRWWRELAAAVNAVGIYTTADAVAFRMLVRDQTLLDAGFDSGEAKVGDLVSLTRAVAGLLTQFGLLPSARDKLRPPPAEASSGEDPDDFSPLNARQ